MSENIPESQPTSADPRSKRPTKKRALTPRTGQAAQLEALFAHPDREIRIPAADAPKKGQLAAPPEIVANVQGSSAGAGSGEFHVYKASRRREYERLRMMDEEVKKEEEEREFRAKREEQERRDRERTERNRKLRMKKREKMERMKGRKGREGEGSESGRDGTPAAENADANPKKKLVANPVPRNPDNDEDNNEDNNNTLNNNSIQNTEETGLIIQDDDD